MNEKEPVNPAEEIAAMLIEDWRKQDRPWAFDAVYSSGRAHFRGVIESEEGDDGRETWTLEVWTLETGDAYELDPQLPDLEDAPRELALRRNITAEEVGAATVDTEH